MSNENKTIHEFELNLICDFFSNMERQGPGSPEVTLKALSFIDNLTDKSLIADINGIGGTYAGTDYRAGLSFRLYSYFQP